MRRRLLELQTKRSLNGSPTESQIAEVLSEEFGIPVSKNAVHGRLWRLGQGVAAHVTPPPFMPFYEKYSHHINDCSINNKPPGIGLAGLSKVLHISDLHIPFQNNGAVETALNLGATCDTLVVSELMEFSSLSPFTDPGRSPIEEEIEATLSFLEMISPRFENVFVVSGNHDARVKRTLAKSLPGELHRLVQDWDMLQLLARPFPNIHVVGNWWFQLGHAIFCHASKSSTISMRAAVDVNNYFLENTRLLGVGPYNVLVQAHTHSLGVVYRGNAKIFESGAMCKVMPWYLSAPRKTIWTTGFIILELMDGVPILNLCREYVLDAKAMLPGGLVLSKR